MTAQRITKKDRFAQLRMVVTLAAETEAISVEEHDDLQTFIAHEVELLSRKSNGNKVMTADQRANEVIKDEIVTLLTNSDPMRAGEIAKMVGGEDGITPQKCTALLKQLTDSGRVTRETVKKVTTFSVPLP